jgi:hypothetical protein
VAANNASPIFTSLCGSSRAIDRMHSQTHLAIRQPPQTNTDTNIQRSNSGSRRPARLFSALYIQQNLFPV